MNAPPEPRPVRNGERLSGHGNEAKGYPSISIKDGCGAGGGSLICGIESFHWADVRVKGKKTELHFENRTTLTITDGIVTYHEVIGDTKAKVA